jgi:hypothetical protein
MILQLLLAMLAGWIQRHQQQVITYLQEENRVLKAQLAAAGFASPIPSAAASLRLPTHSVASASKESPRLRPPKPLCVGTSD